MKKTFFVFLLLLVVLMCVMSLDADRNALIEEAHSKGFEVFYFVENSYNHDYGIVYLKKDGKVSVLNKSYLNYQKYLGKLCYFDDPIEGEYGVSFLPMIIETGETVYVQFYAGRNGNSPSLIYGKVESYDKLIAAQNLVSSDFYLFDGYDVRVADVKSYSFGEEWILTNGNTIWKSTYEYLKKLVDKIPFDDDEQRKAFLDNLLNSEISVLYDDFDEEMKMVVSVNDDFQLTAYIDKNGILNNSFIMITYTGSRWVFIDNVRMKGATSDFSFSSSSYRSVLSGGSVYEAVSYSLNNESLTSFLKKAGEEGVLKIRMSGSNGSTDLYLTAEEVSKMYSFICVLEELENH